MKITVAFFVFAFSLHVVGQDVVIPSSKIEKSKNSFQNPKGNFTISWGYNRDYFSKSNIHFSGIGYDFTLHNLIAKDRPSPISFHNYIDPQRMWVPQYNYRFGYFITNKICLSLGMDHMKYVMVNNQMATISGMISPEASEKYSGTYNKEAILVSPDLLQFEHTNGFNLLSLEIDKAYSLFNFFHQKINVVINSGIGTGALIPKTEVYVFEYGMDNRFHLAGYSFIAKTGTRINFLKRFFLSADLKGGYADLPSVLIHNDAPYRASHSLWFLEYSVSGGVYFCPFTKK